MNRRSFLGGLGLGAVAVGTACAKSGFFPLRPRGVDRKDWRDALAASRNRNVARLSMYRDAGRFPVNHRVLGSIPVFIDHLGVPCAVGHLMQKSGHTQLAAGIARSNNNVYIEELGDGPALDWILFSGLTREECALIQPSYKRNEHLNTDVEVLEPEPEHPEQETLRQHFVLVERRLRGDTEMSLRLAMTRLEPKITGGASISQVPG